MFFDVNQLYDCVDDIDDRKKAQWVMQYFLQCRRNDIDHGLQNIEQVLADCDVTRCGVRVLVALLRSPGEYVRKISTIYRYFCHTVVLHLTSIGRDPQKVMVGLLPVPTKPIVQYKQHHFQRIAVGSPAIILPINHPSDLVSNTGLVQTSDVVYFDKQSKFFETQNTIYYCKLR